MTQNENMTKEDYRRSIAVLEKKLAEEQESHVRTKIKLKMREGENHTITQSTSYKLAKKLAFFKHVLRLISDRLRRMNPKTQLMLQRNKRYVLRGYRSEEFTSAFEAPATAKIVVVIHLFYPDMLTVFIEKLNRISHLKYDLYITIPDTKREYKAEVIQRLPMARVAIVPNTGRDVLPFTEVMRRVADKYELVLKIHSKKSPHRTDGQKWRDRIMDSLLPMDTKIVDDIQKVLAAKETAIVGPAHEYVSMLVNLSATAHYTKSITQQVAGVKKSELLMRNPNEYGFFGGTMFWARIDSIKPIVEATTASEFEPEFGQQDSTLAHALERLLNIIPELNGKQMYQVDAREGVSAINYATTNIPKWSELALDE